MTIPTDLPWNTEAIWYTTTKTFKKMFDNVIGSHQEPFWSMDDILDSKDDFGRKNLIFFNKPTFLPLKQKKVQVECKK